MVFLFYREKSQITNPRNRVCKIVKSNWITEITHFVKEKFFVDEQRFGPYAMWHHEHHFEELNDGKVLMTDLVNFKLPMGILGDFFAGKFVTNKVKFIFESRFEILEKALIS